jgi:hypothetical protein
MEPVGALSGLSDGPSTPQQFEYRPHFVADQRFRITGQHTSPFMRVERNSEDQSLPAISRFFPRCAHPTVERKR